MRPAALVLPLAAFILVTFVAPLLVMLGRSVHDPLVADALPETLRLLREWDGERIPPEAGFGAIGGELLKARRERTLGRIATRVNRVQAGLRSALLRSVRKLRGAPRPDSWREAMIAIDPKWGQTRTWHAIRRAGERFTLTWTRPPAEASSGNRPTCASTCRC